jgi:hypothetical protein
MVRYSTGEAVQVGDVVEIEGIDSTWRVASLTGLDDMVSLSGPGPCRGLTFRRPHELRLKHRRGK